VRVTAGTRGFAAACAAALLASLAACAAPNVEDPRKMRFDPVKISPPVPRRVVLGNGTVLHLLPDHEVPLVNVKVMVRTGGILDPQGKVGLAEIAGVVLRSGGAGSYAGDELNESLEEMGALLETSVGRTSGRPNLSVLTSDLEKGVELLAEVLRHPRFEPGEIDRAKNRKIEAIRRVNDDPDSIAYRELRPALYGDGPRGRSATPETIGAIERADLAAFHRRYFYPDRLVVGVSGDFSEERIVALWERYFGDWKPAGTAPPAFPAPAAPPPAGVTLVSKGFPQATVLLGHFAPPIDSPDYYAFSIVNYVLGGGGFNSRLTEQIRSNLGLAYSVGSWYSGRPGYGVMVAHLKSGSATAVAAARLMREIIQRVKGEGVMEEEMEWARRSIINGLIFAVDSSAEIVSRRISYEYDGLPSDFLETYPVRLRAVSLDEVNEAARTWLRPLEAPMVAVGDESGFEGSFGEFGEVTNVSLPEY
jgi:predicted Zn-dependent peptidase